MRLSLLTLLLVACTDGSDGKEGDGDCEPVYRYHDRDLDGFGDPTSSFLTCNEEKGVADATDCDDMDADRHPGAEESCADATDYNCDGSAGYADEDADGAPACEDCDDTDPTRFPGAVETCDHVDEDCDGAVDDDPADGDTYYADADGDAHGDRDNTIVACDAPDGYVEDVTDCDDTDADVHPGAFEVCNGVDDNCDGGTDDAEAVDASTFYADSDGDLWGNPDVSVDGCVAPPTYTTIGGDCDDRDADVNPSATEVCDGVDDDCDGGTDDSGAIDALAWYADADDDGHGDATSFVYACELPDDGAETDDDCDDADASVYPGAPETCDGVDEDCDADVDEDATDAPTWYADADADGYGDVASASASCTAPTGTVADATDCDDASAAVNPAATETCDGADDDCDGTTDEPDASGAPTWYADADGDGYGDPAATTPACTQPAGYVANASDCDDATAATSPAATETCDGVDDDCDGTVDEPDAADATSWYLDADADGWGGPSAVTACEAPAGYVATDTDCDDASSLFHPGATETDCEGTTDYNCDGSVGSDDADGDGFAACLDCDDASATANPDEVETCDGADDDCDGTIDEDDAADASTWYADTDGDGYGDAAVSSAACDAPTGSVADATDCDDAEPGVNPGATESCLTTDDDDCDGDTNERNATACSRFYYDYDLDGYGSTSNACLCLASGYLTADNHDDCDDGDAAVSPGAAELWGNGIDDDCDDVVDIAVGEDVADATFVGEFASDGAGTAVAAAGDVNADGYDDLLVGAPGYDLGGTGAGVGYLLLGPLTGDTDLSAADAMLLGESVGDAAGTAIASAGDVNGDGYADLLVGAYAVGASDTGEAYLIYGPVTGTLDLSTADTDWAGTSADESVGYDLAGGVDFDGDGLDDVLAGAYRLSSGGTNAGGAYVFSGLDAGSNTSSDAVATLVGEDRNDYAGRRVAAADLDGDGVGDAVVASNTDDDGGTDAGAVYVVYGPLSGSTDLSLADAKLVGEDASDEAGTALAAPGDLDGDGLADLLIGAPVASTGGRAYVVLGAPSGTVDLAAADATFDAAGARDAAGTAVAGAGDLDADGVLDLVVGSPDNDDGGTDAGAVYPLFGPFSGTLTLGDSALLGGAADDAFGASVAGVGDVDGDGHDDLLVGGTGADDGGTDSGAAWLFLGR